MTTLDRVPGPPSAPEPGPAPVRARSEERFVDRLRRAVERRPLLPATTLGVVALAIQVLGYGAGWSGSTGLAVVLWYVGFVLLCLPFAVLLLAASPTPRERVLGSVVFGLLMYLSWFLASPVYASSFDESLHVTTLARLTAGEGWFTPNSMLPVSPHYPGLELAAGGVHWLTGLPLVACQFVVVALSRTVLVLGLFMVGARIGRSARAGGLVVLLYAASQQFYFFNAQFSYQTLALAMVVATPMMLIRAYDGPRRLPAMVAAQACLATLAITHHLTSWIMLVALAVAGALQWWGGERQRARITLLAAYGAGLVVALWSLIVVPLLMRYLGPVFGSAGEQLVALIERDSAAHPVGAVAAVPTPFWEQAVMFGSMVLWCALLVPATLGVLRGHTVARTPLRLLPLGVAGLYPLTLVARLSPAASEVADRASTFVMLAVVVVVAVWATTRIDSLGLRRVVPAVLVLLVGGAILGSGPDWQRVPGPYLAAAEHRSVDSETLAVGQWAGRYLPEGSRVAADVTLGRVILNAAPVDAVTSASGSVDVTPLYVSISLQEADDVVRAGAVDFVVVDTRLENQPVRSGAFFEGSKEYPGADRLDAAELDKFDGAPGYTLVLDGPVKVYDVRALRGEQVTFADRAAPGLPGTAHPWQTALLVLVGAAVAAALGRRRLGRTRGLRDAWVVAVALPVLVGVGVLATADGFDPADGFLAGTVLLISAGVLLRVRTTRVPLDLAPRARLVAPLLLGVLLAGVVQLAGTNAWHALFDHAPLPAPITQVSAEEVES